MKPNHRQEGWPRVDQEKQKGRKKEDQVGRSVGGGANSPRSASGRWFARSGSAESCISNQSNQGNSRRVGGVKRKSPTLPLSQGQITGLPGCHTGTTANYHSRYTINSTHGQPTLGLRCQSSTGCPRTSAKLLSAAYFQPPFEFSTSVEPRGW